MRGSQHLLHAPEKGHVLTYAIKLRSCSHGAFENAGSESKRHNVQWRTGLIYESSKDRGLAGMTRKLFLTFTRFSCLA